MSDWDAATVRKEVLAGLTTSFAMVPETVAFAFVAGVNPLAGLYASFTSGFIASLWGGRPGMITGGAGSLAVVSAALVASRGVEYLFAAVLLMGLIQVLAGLLRWGKFIELVPVPVMQGFVNGLAIVILLAQLRQIPFGKPELWPSLLVIVVTVSVMALLPGLTKIVPPALMAIGVATALVHGFHLLVPTVGDLAKISGGFPPFHLPIVPISWETLRIVAPYGLVLAGVGLTESLLTQQLVDRVTKTESSSDRECVGQGLGNVVTGLFSGMGGCAMIGQTVINLDSGGRFRLSGIVESLSILAFVVVASRVIGAVPMAALVGVMLVVVFHTFAWKSVRNLLGVPRVDAFVMLLVTTITVFRDLATGVLCGVIVSSLAFAWETANTLTVERTVTDSGAALYRLTGSLFFGSTARFLRAFAPESDPQSVLLDLSAAKLVGQSAEGALETLSSRYAAAGKTLERLT